MNGLGHLVVDAMYLLMIDCYMQSSKNTVLLKLNCKPPLVVYILTNVGMY